MAQNSGSSSPWLRRFPAAVAIADRPTITLDRIRTSGGIRRSGRGDSATGQRRNERPNGNVELVNRMLNAIITDKHLIIETLLWGRITDWDQFYCVDIFRGNIYHGVEIDSSKRERWGPGDEEAVVFWRERKEEMRLQRAGWEAEQLQWWSTTPWHHYRERFLIESFQQAFLTEDEFAASECFTKLLTFCGTRTGWKDGTTFLNHLIGVTENRHDWIFLIVGLLMAAALPVRSGEVSFGIPHGDWQCIMTPSRSARLGFTGQIEIRRQGKHDEQKRSKSELWNPFSGNDKYEHPNPNQMDYVDLAENILKQLCQLEVIVYGSWYDELEKVVGLLREDRKRTLRYGGDGRRAWASTWYFQTPQYTRENLGLKRYDNETKSWVAV
ncbi:hypothetical protein GGR57DRAFT_518229 [Xylariaceae sp. FL1272]|nr:hypothetical protein GGR57DRAFT_518229 [Xylariaceae sp. FL1272]